LPDGKLLLFTENLFSLACCAGTLRKKKNGKMLITWLSPVAESRHHFPLLYFEITYKCNAPPFFHMMECILLYFVLFCFSLQDEALSYAQFLCKRLADNLFAAVFLFLKIKFFMQSASAFSNNFSLQRSTSTYTKIL